jgi:major capsid protein
MANMTPNRFGQLNQAGDPDALFLKVFAGEVLTAFSETNVAASRSMVRTISSGKSAQFPASWKGSAAYHTPGTQLLGTGVGLNERIIVIDDVLIADRSIAQIDELKTHYDVRSIYSKDIGMALARAFDKNLLQVGLLAARAAATVSGGNGGSAITDAAYLTTVANLEAGIFSAVQKLDEKDVPANDRYVAVKPQQYYQLVASSSKVIHGDYNPTPNGGYAQGTVFRIAGVEIVKTNNLPQSNIATGPAAYQGNFTTVAAFVWQKGAMGTVKLLDLAVESGWMMEYQTYLILGKYAVGHGILRPECAVELKTA